MSDQLAEIYFHIIGSKMQDLTTRVDELAILHKIIAERDSLLEELRNEITELKKRIPN